jgi:hypothetical protein
LLFQGTPGRLKIKEKIHYQFFIKRRTVGQRSTRGEHMANYDGDLVPGGIG